MAGHLFIGIMIRKNSVLALQELQTSAIFVTFSSLLYSLFLPAVIFALSITVVLSYCCSTVWCLSPVTIYNNVISVQVFGLKVLSYGKSKVMH
jgi:hypothetical protein